MEGPQAERKHIPVLATESIAQLQIRRDSVCIDCTLGEGGHSRLILEQLGPNGRLIAIDRDAEARASATAYLREVKTEASWEVVAGTFGKLAEICRERDIVAADVIFADIGMSSRQVDEAERGFSYLQDGPLDMRMNRSGTDADERTAETLVNELGERELADIIRRYGEERYAASIARRIVAERRQKRIRGTLQFLEIIRSAVPAAERRKGNPARRTFQALRIAVNRELQELEDLLDAVPELLADRGRCGIISYHSLEDRLIKQRMRTWQKPCTCPSDFPVCVCGLLPLGKVVSGSGIEPSAAEVKRNPRARSARLRVFERLIGDAESPKRNRT